MGKRTSNIMTIEQLVMFCEQNKFYKFDYKESGQRLFVGVPAVLSFEDEPTRGLMKVKVKVCHTLLNRNGSHVSEENMKRCMPTLKYRPLLGYIHQLDNGEYDFHAHDINVIQDENGNEQYEYLEQQIGTFTEEEPYLEYDEKMDKTYVNAYAVIPEEYTRAADIIRSKEGTKVSCELAIESMSYNAKEKYLDLEDFYFSGVTCLGSEKNGEEIGEGMLGSRADITDFTYSNIENYEGNSLVDVLDKLNNTLSSIDLNIKNPRKEGSDMGNEKFEEEVVETVDESVEETVVEEAEETTEESIDEVTETEEETVEETPEVDEVIDTVEEAVEEKFVKSFEISHSDIRCALYNLLSSYEETDNEWYFITDVYDSHFVYENWEGSQIYGQSYKKDDDNVSFDGERYSLHKELLTDSEYAELQDMRSNYSLVLNQLNQYKANEEKAEKEAVFASEEYADYIESEEFVELKNNMDKYSIEDLKKECDLAFAKCVKKLGFSHENKIKNKVNKLSVPVMDKIENKPKVYGNIFDNVK